MSYPRRVAEDFSAASVKYDDFANLQRDVIDIVSPLVAEESCVLDAGAGTGYAMRDGWQAMDIAEGMCQKVEGSVCADMQAMPFVDNAFDGIFSSLSMQWLDNPSKFLQEAHRCTNDEGWIVLATLGKGTLVELRDSFNKSGIFAPLLPFSSSTELEEKIFAEGWKLVNSDVKTITMQHKNVYGLLQHLKGLGARYKSKTSGGLRGSEWLRALEVNYSNRQSDAITSSWEVITIKAEKF